MRWLMSGRRRRSAPNRRGPAASSVMISTLHLSEIWSSTSRIGQPSSSGYLRRQFCMPWASASPIVASSIVVVLPK
jgi:hypothetical protein